VACCALTAWHRFHAVFLQPIVFQRLHEDSPYEALSICDLPDMAESFVTWRHVVEALNSPLSS
jgi:hypothetical protein